MAYGMPLTGNMKVNSCQLYAEKKKRYSNSTKKLTGQQSLKRKNHRRCKSILIKMKTQHLTFNDWKKAGEKYLYVFRRQWDTNRTHNLLRQWLLTARPSKHINQSIIVISSFTIWAVYKVILWFLGFSFMPLRWCNGFHHLLSGKAEFIPSNGSFLVKLLLAYDFTDVAIQSNQFSRM